MNKERIDDLVDLLGERYAELENTFVIKNNQELLKFVDNPEEWKRLQLRNRAIYKNDLIRTAKKELANLDNLTEKVYLLSYKEINKDAIQISKTEINVKQLNKDAIKDIQRMKEMNAKEITNLANIGYKTYVQNVKIISQTSSADALYDEIKSKIILNANQGLSVQYSNGRNLTWKSYMEMNVRTTVHQEIGDQQLKVGKELNQVFYFCDEFADCAKDHADYQGKYYYDENATRTEAEQKYIDDNDIKSIQEVRDGDPFLTTRPNCRHSFHFVQSSELLDDSFDKSEFQFGKYKDSNYEKLQDQRYNERQIRKYKLDAENYDRQYASTKDSDFKARADEAKSLMRSWQSQQRTLVKENDFLKRNYDRENAKVIAQDLGIKYDYKIVNDKLVEKK